MVVVRLARTTVDAFSMAYDDPLGPLGQAVLGKLTAQQQMQLGDDSSGSTSSADDAAIAAIATVAGPTAREAAALPADMVAGDADAVMTPVDEDEEEVDIAAGHGSALLAALGCGRRGRQQSSTDGRRRFASSESIAAAPATAIISGESRRQQRSSSDVSHSAASSGSTVARPAVPSLSTVRPALHLQQQAAGITVAPVDATAAADSTVDPDPARSLSSSSSSRAITPTSSSRRRLASDYAAMSSSSSPADRTRAGLMTRVASTGAVTDVSRRGSTASIGFTPPRRPTAQQQQDIINSSSGTSPSRRGRALSQLESYLQQGATLLVPEVVVTAAGLGVQSSLRPDAAAAPASNASAAAAVPSASDASLVLSSGTVPRGLVQGYQCEASAAAPSSSLWRRHHHRGTHAHVPVTASLTSDSGSSSSAAALMTSSTEGGPIAYVALPPPTAAATALPSPAVAAVSLLFGCNTEEEEEEEEEEEGRKRLLDSSGLPQPLIEAAVVEGKGADVTDSITTTAAASSPAHAPTAAPCNRRRTIRRLFAVSGPYYLPTVSVSIQSKAGFTPGFLDTVFEGRPHRYSPGVWLQGCVAAWRKRAAAAAVAATGAANTATGLADAAAEKENVENKSTQMHQNDEPPAATDGGSGSTASRVIGPSDADGTDTPDASSGSIGRGRSSSKGAGRGIEARKASSAKNRSTYTEGEYAAHCGVDPYAAHTARDVLRCGPFPPLNPSHLPPISLFHGTADTTCPHACSTHLHAVLSRHCGDGVSSAGSSGSSDKRDRSSSSATRSGICTGTDDSSRNSSSNSSRFTLRLLPGRGHTSPILEDPMGGCDPLLKDMLRIMRRDLMGADAEEEVDRRRRTRRQQGEESRAANRSGRMIWDAAQISDERGQTSDPFTAAAQNSVVSGHSVGGTQSIAADCDEAAISGHSHGSAAAIACRSKGNQADTPSYTIDSTLNREAKSYSSRGSNPNSGSSGSPPAGSAPSSVASPVLPPVATSPLVPELMIALARWVNPF